MSFTKQCKKVKVVKRDATEEKILAFWRSSTNDRPIKLLCLATCVSKLLLHSAKTIELRRGIQTLQAKTSVGTTLVGPHDR